MGTEDVRKWEENISNAENHASLVREATTLEEMRENTYKAIEALIKAIKEPKPKTAKQESAERISRDIRYR